MAAEQEITQRIDDLEDLIDGRIADVESQLDEVIALLRKTAEGGATDEESHPLTHE